MNVLLCGATGMVGQGVLRECLLDPDVQRVQTVGRTRTGVRHPKLRELVHQDMWHYRSIEADLSGLDACFFCLGVSSAGMAEADYERVTYGITMAAAETLSRLDPRMTFVYVSGAGTDSSEGGRTMWARVKGKTENALLRLPFKAAYMFRPGAIQPLYGVRSKTTVYRVMYSLTRPLLPLLRWAMPGYILTTEQLGRAMVAVAKHGASKRILESRDISAIVPACDQYVSPDRYALPRRRTDVNAETKQVAILGVLRRVSGRRPRFVCLGPSRPRDSRRVSSACHRVSRSDSVRSEWQQMCR